MSQMVQDAEQWQLMLFENHYSLNPNAPTEQRFYSDTTFLFCAFSSVRLKREKRAVWSPLPHLILTLEIEETTERGKQRNRNQKVKKTIKETPHSSKLNRLFKALHESPFNEGPIPSEACGIITLKLDRISFTSSKLGSDEPWPSLNKWM